MMRWLAVLISIVTLIPADSGTACIADAEGLLVDGDGHREGTSYPFEQNFISASLIIFVHGEAVPTYFGVAIDLDLRIAGSSSINPTKFG